MDRLLLADDDVELTEMLQEFLEAEDFAVDVVHDGEAALDAARSGGYALAVLDVMMPKMNGLDVLRELRRDSQLPVLVLTARGDEVDSIVGLELGADDYLPKPASPRALTARIRAILRRARASGDADPGVGAGVLRLGDLEIHGGSRSATLAGEPLALTSTEFSMLEVLAGAAGGVVGKQELSLTVLGRKLTAYDRNIDMHISNLRKKLGPLPNGDERIKTVRGVGYQYVLGAD